MNPWTGLMVPEKPQPRRRPTLMRYRAGYSALRALRDGGKVADLPGASPKARQMLALRLLDSKLVTRVERGVYRTTPAGLAAIATYEEKNPCTSNER